MVLQVRFRPYITKYFTYVVMYNKILMWPCWIQFRIHKQTILGMKLKEFFVKSSAILDRNVLAMCIYCLMYCHINAC